MSTDRSIRATLLPCASIKVAFQAAAERPREIDVKHEESNLRSLGCDKIKQNLAEIYILTDRKKYIHHSLYCGLIYNILEHVVAYFVIFYIS